MAFELKSIQFLCFHVDKGVSYIVYLYIFNKIILLYSFLIIYTLFGVSFNPLSGIQFTVTTTVTH